MESDKQSQLEGLVELLRAELTKQTKPYLNTREAAKCLSVSYQQMEAWRLKGGGPQFLKLAERIVRYRHTDLDEWVQSCSRRHTSEPRTA